MVMMQSRMTMSKKDKRKEEKTTMIDVRDKRMISKKMYGGILGDIRASTAKDKIEDEEGGSGDVLIDEIEDDATERDG